MSIIYQFISYGKAAKLANPAMAKGKRILIIAGIVVVVLALAGYGFGFYYYSRGQVADRYESATYVKFDSYASNHNTTPDCVSDIFLNDTDDTMYKDVTADIDKNTTGAKNRSADSITFSDVDVTKVVQTGEKNFKVTFTAVYDFFMAMIRSSSHQEILKTKFHGHVMWNMLVTIVTLVVAVLTTATTISMVKLSNHKK